MGKLWNLSLLSFLQRFCYLFVLYKGKNEKKIKKDKDEMNKSQSGQSLHLPWHWVDKKNVFVFSKEIDHLPSTVVYSIGRHRWDIDANIFMDMVKHWHLKHKTIHFEKAYENMWGNIFKLIFLPFRDGKNTKIPGNFYTFYLI